MSGSSLDTPAGVPRAESLSCPSCGAAIAQRAAGWAVTIACGSCGAVLDATDPHLRVLQQQEDAIHTKPQLPLGTRGTWRGAAWELIGFQVVTISVEGTEYSWTEYVAFNPYRGFLYLSEYQGHWNVIVKQRRQFREDRSGARPTVLVDAVVFKHFQTATATTTLALGEFPWALRVGDRVLSKDYIAPPYILSEESSDGESTWSLGTYTPPEVIAKAFPSAGTLRAPAGTFANQPSPYSATSSNVWRLFALMLVALAAMLVANVTFSSKTVAYTSSQTFFHGSDDSAAFVTPTFALEGRPSAVDIDIDARISNDWVYYGLALINESNGETRETGTQVSYYRGQDSDGSWWEEGSTHERVRVASVPAGRWFLRVAPEGGESGTPPVAYTLRVRRDVPSYTFYAIALVALLVPAFLAFIPAASFEARRWAESDYAPETSSDSSDSGDDE